MSATPIRLLFVTYGGGHVDIVLRLLPLLDALPGVEARVLALTTAGPRLAQTGRFHISCHDYLPRPGYERAMELGAELSSELWDVTTGITWEESCAYLGVSMLDLIRDLGEAEARQRYQQEGRHIFCPVSFLTEVLHEEQPQMVITTCHVRMERAAVLAARRSGIPSVRIEDLFGYSMLGEYGAGRDAQLLPEDEWPDEVVVLNSEIGRRLVVSGFPAERVHPLGQPVLSEWLAAFADSPPSATLADWQKEGRPVITYATPARRDVLYDQTDALITVAKRHPEWGICIKLHPSVGHGEFLERYPQLSANLRVITEEDILPVVRASTLVMIFRSTVGLLCLSAGVPLLVVDETGEPEVIPYVSDGGARGIDRLEQLDDTLAAMLEASCGAVGKPVSPLFENPPEATEHIATWLVERAKAGGVFS